jgi:hypothetical protein
MRVPSAALTLSLILCGLAGAAPAEAQHTYKVLATARTSTMQSEMDQAGKSGYRFVAVMGGSTAIGGREVVVLMEKTEGDTMTYSYRLLATSKTSTLQKELQDAGDAGYGIVGQTVFESTFGGRETAAIVERRVGEDVVRYEYRLVATTKTSTLERELRDLAELGFQALDLTVGQTAFGGSEIVVITRRKAR